MDIELPDVSGLELHELLTRTAEILPVVFVTGHGDIPTGVKAIKTGAVDFLTKPVAKDTLLAAVDQALTQATIELSAREHARAVRMRYERLTPREREVFAHVISGQLNKQVAYDLGASERTIKAHRHSIMVKLEAESVADLIAIALELRIPPRRDTR
jgi:FixJ family two-component response regulator